MDIERIEDWIGREVLDGDGNKLGKLKEVYFRGEDPEVGEVKPGALSRKRIYVPLAGAAATRDSLKVEQTLADDHDVSGLESSTDRDKRLAEIREAEERAEEADAAAARAAVDAEDAAAQARAAEEAATKADEDRRVAAARVERVRNRDVNPS